jgi:hypothetical protein
MRHTIVVLSLLAAACGSAAITAEPDANVPDPSGDGGATSGGATASPTTGGTSGGTTSTTGGTSGGTTGPGAGTVQRFDETTCTVLPGTAQTTVWAKHAFPGLTEADILQRVRVTRYYPATADNTGAVPTGYSSADGLMVKDGEAIAACGQPSGVYHATKVSFFLYP